MHEWLPTLHALLRSPAHHCLALPMLALQSLHLCTWGQSVVRLRYLLRLSRGNPVPYPHKSAAEKLVRLRFQPAFMASPPVICHLWEGGTCSSRPSHTPYCPVSTRPLQPRVSHEEGSIPKAPILHKASAPWGDPFTLKNNRSIVPARWSGVPVQALGSPESTSSAYPVMSYITLLRLTFP